MSYINREDWVARNKTPRNSGKHSILTIHSSFVFATVCEVGLPWKSSSEILSVGLLQGHAARALELISRGSSSVPKTINIQAGLAFNVSNHNYLGLIQS
eukprot:6441954-Amphidinium_carterae.1